MMSVALIMAAIVFVLEYTGAEQMLAESKGTRVIGFFLTFVIVSLFWSAGIASSLGDFVSLINGITLRANDYRIYYVYIAMSGRLYIITAVFAVILAPVTCLSRRILAKLSDKLANVAEAAAVLLLLLLFAFTVMYYMPQYPEYAVRAFRYFIF